MRLIALTAALITPAATFAMSITTAPASQPAPALAAPLLAILALIFLGLGVYGLRNRANRSGVAVALMLGVLGLAGFVYASTCGIVIQGADCNHEVTTPFASSDCLVSRCTNQIAVVAMDLSCGSEVTGTTVLRPCAVGMVLNEGERCDLPGCPG